MKILLSAYACEPDRGSEPAVGWNRAVELAKLGFDVSVLTRKNNENRITKKIAEEPEKYRNLRFHYLDLPVWMSWWKKGQRGVHLYYFLWQIKAKYYVKNLINIESFQIIHHVTFVSIRQPSFLSNLGIPFIFGPVGGGESAPFSLRKELGIRGIVRDTIREIANILIKLDPFINKTFKDSARIIVTTKETKKVLPEKFYNKTITKLAIGLDQSYENIVEKNATKVISSDQCNILYVGRFSYEKGLHIGFQSFSRLVKKYPKSIFTLVGEGPEKRNLLRFAEKIGIKDKIKWLPWQSKSSLHKIYAAHHIFYFPSLHDSGGMVVLEAMAHGLPVICLRLGGPGVIVNSACGYPIETDKKTSRIIANEFCEHTIHLLENQEIYLSMSKAAKKRAEEFLWRNVVNKQFYYEVLRLQKNDGM